MELQTKAFLYFMIHLSLIWCKVQHVGTDHVLFIRSVNGSAANGTSGGNATATLVYADGAVNNNASDQGNSTSGQNENLSFEKSAGPANQSAVNRTEESETDEDISGLRVFLPEQEMEARILGGQECWAHSWPWQVLLRYATMPACGGAILTHRWVVTAAHCFKRYNNAAYWTVMAGKHDIDNPNEKCQQLAKVAKIVDHRGYRSRTKVHDVALVQLQSPLEFTVCVRPISIWLRALPTHRKCTITGWGSTRENGPRVYRLQEVNVTVLASPLCNRFYRGKVRTSMFCAGDVVGGVDACQGDSGGPLSCYTGDRYELAGVVSWGVGCGRSKRPGVYTKLQHYTNWINSAMLNEMEADAPEISERCGRAEVAPCGLGGAMVRSEGGAVWVEGVSAAYPHSWPWQASLQSQGRHYCSGALIHPRWVLAPRHCCCRAGSDVVVLGGHDLRFMATQTVLVEEVFSIARDGSFPPNSDLSLIQLSVPARLGATVFPVCVPDEEDDDEDEEFDDGWSCVTIGWGSTKATLEVSPDVLHQARLTPLSGTSCRAAWGEGLIRKSHLCAAAAGSVSCMGDSGGPLLCQKHGIYHVVGMATWGSMRCDPGKPAIFTRVSAFRSWIRNITKDHEIKT